MTGLFLSLWWVWLVRLVQSCMPHIYFPVPSVLSLALQNTRTSISTPEPTLTGFMKPTCYQEWKKEEEEKKKLVRRDWTAAGVCVCVCVPMHACVHAYRCIVVVNLFEDPVSYGSISIKVAIPLCGQSLKVAIPLCGNPFVWADFPRSTPQPQPGLFLVLGLNLTAYNLERWTYVKGLLTTAILQDVRKGIHYVI